MTKIFEGFCPKCKSENLEYSVIEPYDEEISRDVECRNCEHRFTLWSKCDWEIEEE